MTWRCRICRARGEGQPVEVQCLACGQYVRAHQACAEQHSEGTLDVVRLGMLEIHRDRNNDDHCPGRMPVPRRF